MLLGFGVVCAWDPLGMLGRLDIGASSLTGVNELRAFYGGFEIGIGIFLLLCAFGFLEQRTGLVAVMCSFGAIGIVRLLGAFSSADTSTWTVVACGVELGVACVGGLLLSRRKRRR